MKYTILLLGPFKSLSFCSRDVFVKASIVHWPVQHGQPTSSKLLFGSSLHHLWYPPKAIEGVCSLVKGSSKTCEGSELRHLGVPGPLRAHGP